MFFFYVLQFRLAFVSPESRVVGAGDLVDNPRKIAQNYLSGFFPLDLFIVLPLPKIMFQPVYHLLSLEVAKWAGSGLVKK